MRINERDLNIVINRLNEITGNPTVPHSKDDNGIFRSNIGNYHLDCAYGGYALHQIASKGGAVNDIFGWYYPKRELYNLVHAYIAGIETK